MAQEIDKAIYLKPGEFYTIMGSKRENPRLLISYNCMYVREEYLDAELTKKWSVFAGVWVNDLLMRIRTPKGTLFPEDKSQHIKTSDSLVTKLILLPRAKRTPIVNSFIDCSYNLINSQDARLGRDNIEEFSEFESGLRRVVGRLHNFY